VVEMGHNPMLSYTGTHYSTLNPISLHQKMLYLIASNRLGIGHFQHRLLNYIGFSRFTLLPYATTGAQKGKISKKKKKAKETIGSEQ